MSKQNYTIFINQTAIVLTKSPQKYPPILDLKNILKLAHKFQKDFMEQRVELPVSSPAKALLLLKKHIRFIVAAGGLVEENNQYLYIKRNGFWDLPKGKIEPGETIAQGAVREVSEECGIPLPVIVKSMGISYHIYQMNQRLILKETHWYLMKLSEKVDSFSPQAIEGITEVAFYNKDFLLQPNTKTYQNLKDLIHRIV
jgi:8-oxo-dGTP pyrophosphatase MutT (NUDIX family)